ncbi:MAG: DUF2179 domain-containing protein [Syntrophomonadaceae bacterium]|nr:DUF2179 domain-containing protein [Syntrophomonadaceae bacterium]
MSLDVIRILMLMRGRKLAAALIGFVEVFIFILALGQVLQGGLNDIFKVIAYAGGFAVGNYVGSILEEKMAIGHLSLTMYPTEDYLQEFMDRFREAGFGVTCIHGQGRSGERTFLSVLLTRKDLYRALNLIKEIDPQTFYHVSDTRHIKGGVFPRKSK